MEDKSIWLEIRNDYTDENGDTYIDAFETEDENEEGKVIAIVHKDGKVDYKDERAETDEYAIEMINDAVSNTLTSLPVYTLDEMILYMEDIYNNLISGDMADNVGKCYDIPRYLKFLKNVRKLYWICIGCGRLVAPDEEYVTSDETPYCMRCANEGRI